MVANQKPWSLILAGKEWPLKANFVAFMAISKLKLQNIVKISPPFILIIPPIIYESGLILSIFYILGLVMAIKAKTGQTAI